MTDGVPEARRAMTSYPDGAVPASRGQARLWFLHELHGADSAYNVSYAIRLRGPLRADALARALQQVVDQHESLRTTFRYEDGVLLQRVRPTARLELRRQSLAVTGEDELRRAVRPAANLPFSLNDASLLRATLFEVGDGDHVLLLTLHHSITDGWSKRLIVEEVRDRYAALVEGRAPETPEAAPSYAEFALLEEERRRGGAYETDLAYWAEQLRALPVIEWPRHGGGTRPPGRGASRLEFSLAGALVTDLRKAGRQSRASLFMVLLGAYTVLLNRITGAEDLVVGVPVANRPPEWERTVGFFVNTVAIRVDLRGAPSFRDVLDRVRLATLAALTHQKAPFDLVTASVVTGRRSTASPVFQTMCNLYEESGALSFAGLSAELFEVERTAALCDLELNLAARPEGLRAAFDFNTSLFDQDAVERMADSYQQVLAMLAADPSVTIDRLDPPSARRPEPAATLAPDAAGPHEPLRRQASEIEHYLLRYPGLSRAVVTSHRDAAGTAHLVAHYVAADPPGDEALREHLRRWLPEAMLPAFYTPLAALPLTPSGDVDRRALPRPPS